MDNLIDAYFNYGVDIKLRRVFLGDITEESAASVVKGLYYLDTIGKEPIELFINSGGGDLYQCLAIHDIIRTLGAPVHTFAYGACHSAAPLLLAVGSSRWVSENCSFMVHQYSDELEGKGAALTADVKQGMSLFDNWTVLLSEYSKKQKRFWKSKISRSADFYFSADKAIEWGLADAIWSER